MAMAKRITLSKKLRFEVFKRDSFTCQYCGKKVPDIVLHIDHISPVSKGGTNDITNLITSCVDCNLGKSDNTLDDNSVVVKKRRQLELLQEKREQIEMMYEWQNSLSQMDDESLAKLTEYIEGKMLHSFSLNETGKNNLKKLIKKFPLQIILESVDDAALTYLKFADDTPTKESVEDFIQKIPRIVIVKTKPPIEQKIIKVL